MSQWGNDPHQRERGRIKREGYIGLSLKPRLEKGGGEKEGEVAHLRSTRWSKWIIPLLVVSIAFLSAFLISSFRLSILIEIYWNLESIPRSFHGENADVYESFGCHCRENALCAWLYAGHSIWTLPIIKTFTLRSRIRQWMFISSVKWYLHARIRDNVSIDFELINVVELTEVERNSLTLNILSEYWFSNRALIN